MKKNNIPALRFPQFNEPWVVKKLGEIFTFKNGINASKEQYGTGTKFINVSEVLSEKIINYNNIPGRVNVSSDIIDKYSVEYGDILFQRSSETREEVGTSNVYLDKDNNATFGGFVIRGRFIVSQNPLFINYLLKTECARNEITSKSGGSTRYNVGQDTLSAVPISLPTLPEQQKIADFLSGVDEKIGQLERRLALEEQYKKGMMQRLFDQEIRFKDDNGNEFPDWEEKKLGEVARIFDGTHTTPDYKDCGIPFYSVETISRNVEHKYISKEAHLENTKKNKPQKGDILITRIGTLCKSRIVDWDSDFSIYVSLANISPKKHVNTKYLFQYINTNNYYRDFLSKSLLVAIPQKINMEDLKQTIISLPTLPEQQKIADFLSSLDDKIGQTKAELEKARIWKRGLMQRMFV